MEATENKGEAADIWNINVSAHKVLSACDLVSRTCTNHEFEVYLRGYRDGIAALRNQYHDDKRDTKTK